MRVVAAWCKTKPFLSLFILALFLALGAACAVNPVTGRQELVFMSVQEELAMGARYYPEMTQAANGLPPNDPQLQTYVSDLGQRLAASSHRPQMPWEFNVVNTGEINAYALPGGKISVTRGMMTAVQSEDELAGVLGHEIGHVTARHGVAQHARGILTQVTAIGVGVGLSVSESARSYALPATLAVGVAGQLMMLSYSRDQERQSDELGYVYMTKNNYNPKGMVNLFNTFKKQETSEPGFMAALLASHPVTSERIALAEQRLRSSPPALANQPLKTQEFQKAVARQLDRKPAYEAMDQGDAYLSRRDYKNALASYQKASRLYSEEGLFQTKTALALQALGRKPQALAAADKAASLSPNMFLAQYVRGSLYYQNNNPRAALPSLERAAALMPEHGDAALKTAASYERLGARQQALAYYGKAAALSDQESAAKARLRIKALQSSR